MQRALPPYRWLVAALVVVFRMSEALKTWRRNTFSSTVPQVLRRYTMTGRVWPMR